MAETPERKAARRSAQWVWIALVLFALLAIVYTRALLESHSELQGARDLVETDVAEAIRHYRHAVEWYAPGNPFNRRAVQELYQLAMAEIHTDADRHLVLLAAESLRTGILVTRSFYTPHREVLEPIEARIAQIRAEDLSGDDPEALAAEQNRQLGLLKASRQRAPDPFWATVTSIAFLLWIACTWLAVRQASAAKGAWKRRRTAILAVSSAAALILWIVGLTLV
ncbi:MAG: hypothetical protein JW797_11025 [Bradymonadales bacterium]|nr:hypothetical protein [Bradymonadales bacterium]